VRTGQQSLQNCGFKVIRKRRATVQDFNPAKLLNTETPKRRRPSVGNFSRPKTAQKAALTEQDYVLQEDNLVSTPDEARQMAMDALTNSEVVITDLIKRRSVLPGNDRRPSAIISSRKRVENGESPVSFRTKRCLSLCSPNVAGRKQHRGLRERNRSVNDFNLPKSELNPALMDNNKLTGDFKRVLSLPLCTGKEHDLKYIDDKTLVQLQNGTQPDVVTTIIDARYPYEYQGGHIKGAINLYTEDMILDYFYGRHKGQLDAIGQKENGAQKHLIVFHCEFSSQRAPTMLRFLRKTDRARNAYPTLDFPELYLLRDGYKNFFNLQSAYTTGTYLPMKHPSYDPQFQQFRKKCPSLKSY